MPKYARLEKISKRRLEAYYRGKLAAQVNKAEAKWLPEINSGSGLYVSGRPDATILLPGGRVVFVEIKAAWGTVALGDETKERTRGWHYSQRQWWRNVAKPMRAPYYIVLAMAPKAAVFAKEALWYVVPPSEWLSFQEVIGKKSARFDEIDRAFASLQTAADVAEFLTEVRDV